jgi:hypothetical protein
MLRFFVVLALIALFPLWAPVFVVGLFIYGFFKALLS